jgi:hypothetical protein
MLYSGGVTVPKGKELEQLPMSNIAPGIGDEQSKMNRTSLKGTSAHSKGTRGNKNNK